MCTVEFKLNWVRLFPVSYEEAVQKVNMLRSAPVIYNRRRLNERPIPVIPAANQVEASMRSRPRRRHSVPSALLRRSSLGLISANNNGRQHETNHKNAIANNIVNSPARWYEMDIKNKNNTSENLGESTVKSHVSSIIEPAWHCDAEEPYEC